MVNLLLGFEGRISRTQFWIGLVIIVAVEFILMWFLEIPFFPAEMKGLPARLIEFALQLVLLYPTAAIAVKRLHDRDKPGIYVLWLVGLTLIIALTNLFGLTDDPKNPTWLDWALGFCAAVIGLAFLIELGFRRGTPGDNRYGPDPLTRPMF
jgi:uncharacterized membrane protein YhaH (DUF805 family)